MLSHCKEGHVGKRNTAADSDEGYLATVYEWSGDMAQEHMVGVRFVLTPTDRHGVWKIRVEACHVVDKTALGVVCQVPREFPNGRSATLAATMFSMIAELSRVLGEDALNRD